MWNITDNRGEDLEEYLISQLVTLPLTEKEQEIAEYLIDLLDSRGYLEDELSIVSENLCVEDEEVLRMLKVVQSLEPAGVGARNLSECLLLQLDRQKMDEPLVRAIVKDYLEQLGKNQLPQIARKLKVTVEEVMQALEVIQTLNPKPGNSFSSRENLKYITPDVTVVKLKGYYEILLNEYMYPRMSINNYYRSMMKNGSDRETKEYVSTKVRQAEWIMQCVSQRNVTLMNVSKCIVDVQERFFTYGPGYLQPLKLADVAETIGVHESTVSRAVKDKYLQCSWGIYPMNYFFIGSISKKGTDSTTTADTAKTLLKEIIDGENKEKPYSDRVLADKLMEKGVKISRRTVTKYREALGIRDASGRKIF
jgi:RNA polymerase sigma-54 factor